MLSGMKQTTKRRAMTVLLPPDVAERVERLRARGAVVGAPPSLAGVLAVLVQRGLDADEAPEARRYAGPIPRVIA
jgi:hypothetical protein